MQTKQRQLAAQLVERLRQRHWLVACAESCTGGLLAGAITDIAGVSQVLEFSVVTYCDAVKHRVLGVAEQTLAEKTAVSAETAAEMALGIQRLAGSDLALSVTGLAGPGGATAEQPVGLVYFGVACKGEVETWRSVFSGSRIEIRERAVQRALELALAALV